MRARERAVRAWAGQPRSAASLSPIGVESLPRSPNGMIRLILSRHGLTPRHSCDYASNSLAHRLMFPNTEDAPSSCIQNRRLPKVPVPRSADLRLPKIAIGDRHLAVLRASVPEAAVDEHNDFAAGEHDVWSEPLAPDQKREVLSESQT